MAISEINVEQLVRPISEDNPIGEDVERLGIASLREMAEGEQKTQWSPHVPPNWKNVYRTAQKYLKTGKDLWAAHYLTTSAMELYEFDGLIKGLEVIKQLLEKYWDNIHPLLEPEDEEDFTMARLSPVGTLCARSEYLYQKLTTMPLVKTNRLGTFSFKELKTLADEHGIRKKEHESVELNHIYSDVKSEYLDTLTDHFKKCLELFTAIDDFINEKVGIENNNAKINIMTGLFNELITFFKENLTFSPEELEDAEDAGGIGETETTEADPKEKTAPKKRKGKLINDRKDIEKVFNEVCRWLEENEPSSPVLVFTENARDLLGKKYIETSGEISNMFTKLNRTIRLFDGQSSSSNSSYNTQADAKETTGSTGSSSPSKHPPMPTSQVKQGQEGTISAPGRSVV